MIVHALNSVDVYVRRTFMVEDLCVCVPPAVSPLTKSQESTQERASPDGDPGL